MTREYHLVPLAEVAAWLLAGWRHSKKPLSAPHGHYSALLWRWRHE